MHYRPCKTPECGGWANATGKCPSCVVREARTPEDREAALTRRSLWPKATKGFPRGSGSVRQTA